MENFCNEEKELEDFLQLERKKNRYDPRKDLSEDHELWQVVLKEAGKVDRQLYGNLHGFRCMGCRLKKNKNILRLIPAPDYENYQEDRREYLLPYKAEIKDIFQKVARNRCNIDVEKKKV